MTHDGIIHGCGGLGQDLGTKFIRIKNYSRLKYAVKLETDGLTEEQIVAAEHCLTTYQDELYQKMHEITGDPIQYTPADHDPYLHPDDPDVIALCEGEQGQE